MRISDWSSDVCSSDLPDKRDQQPADRVAGHAGARADVLAHEFGFRQAGVGAVGLLAPHARVLGMGVAFADALVVPDEGLVHLHKHVDGGSHAQRSEEHTSELQSLMRISYAVFCLN